MSDLHPILLDRLNAALAPDLLPSFTPRDLRLPEVPGKIHAVTGMRRAGKTTYLRQLQAEQRKGRPTERVLLLSFDDDRLADLQSDQLALLLEAYYRRFPETRGVHTVTWLLDEVQLVDGWERFVRRVMDTEKVQVVVSGSSARMLSREVHTSLRGRGMETIVRPFSFREFLRHRGEEPAIEAAGWTSAQRSLVENRFDEYLGAGGFPESQGVAAPIRTDLLQSYVDTVLFRDILERHRISQVSALRWLIRQCLRNPGGLFSVHRLHLDLRAQGYGVAKDTLHAMIDQLLDAFVISALPLATDSERQRNSNPRKIYPADPGLIAAFDSGGRSNVGHALETVVHIELLRRKAEQGYVKTPSGYEVDFLARYPGAAPDLIQVCADPTDPGTLQRELRALADAAIDHPRAQRRLLVLTRDQARAVAAPSVQVQPAYEWLLDPPASALDDGSR